MGNLYNKMEEVPLDPPRVVVRYHEDWVSQVEMLEDTLAQELGQRFPDLRSMPVFSNQELDVLAGLVQEAKVRDETYQPIDFAVFRYLDAPPGPGQVDLAKELLRSKNVQDAYIARVGPDPSVNATDDPRSSLQGYLDPAPIGVNARYAWKFAGGDGADQRLLDLERGWTLTTRTSVATTLPCCMAPWSTPHERTAPPCWGSSARPTTA